MNLDDFLDWWNTASCTHSGEHGQSRECSRCVFELVEGDQVVRKKCCEHERHLAYKLGIVSALEDLPAKFRQRAGESFIAGCDDEAALFRRLAEEYESKARDERAAYDQERKKAKP